MTGFQTPESLHYALLKNVCQCLPQLLLGARVFVNWNSISVAFSNIMIGIRVTVDSDRYRLLTVALPPSVVPAFLPSPIIISLTIANAQLRLTHAMMLACVIS